MSQEYMVMLHDEEDIQKIVFQVSISNNYSSTFFPQQGGGQRHPFLSQRCQYLLVKKLENAHE